MNAASAAPHGARPEVAMSAAGWLAAMDLDEADVPRLVVLEGSWWRAERTAQRLAVLDEVVELGFPEWHLGRHRGVPVAYSCVYGAPRAVEPVHVFGQLGSAAVVQIGSCGGLADGVATGDVVVADAAAVGEGASQYYSEDRQATGSPSLAAAAQVALEARRLRAHRGSVFTTSALFAQPAALVDDWRRAGHLGVDMETSAVFTVARRFGMAAVAVLFVWDELARGRGFLDPFTPDERAAQARANDALFHVALEVGLGPAP